MAVVFPLTYLDPFTVGYLDTDVDEVDLGTTSIYMLGDIEMNSNRLTNLPGSPYAVTDVASKAFVDSLTSADPAKMYVMPTVVACEDFQWHDLSGVPAYPIDDVDIYDGDRVLLIGQSDASENGIWVVDTGSWTRPTADDDFKTGLDASAMLVSVAEGTLYGEAIMQCVNTPGNADIDTDNLIIEPKYTGSRRVYFSGTPSLGDLQEGEIVMVWDDYEIWCRSADELWSHDTYQKV